MSYHVELRHSYMEDDDRPGRGQDGLKTIEEAQAEIQRIVDLWTRHLEDHYPKSTIEVSEDRLSMVYRQQDGWTLTIKAVQD